MIKNTLIIVRKFSVYSNFHRVWHGHIIKCGPGKHHKIRRQSTGKDSKSSDKIEKCEKLIRYIFSQAKNEFPLNEKPETKPVCKDLSHTITASVADKTVALNTKDKEQLPTTLETAAKQKEILEQEKLGLKERIAFDEKLQHIKNEFYFGPFEKLSTYHAKVPPENEEEENAQKIENIKEPSLVEPGKADEAKLLTSVGKPSAENDKETLAIETTSNVSKDLAEREPMSDSDTIKLMRSLLARYSERKKKENYKLLQTQKDETKQIDKRVDSKIVEDIPAVVLSEASTVTSNVNTDDKVQEKEHDVNITSKDRQTYIKESLLTPRENCTCPAILSLIASSKDVNDHNEGKQRKVDENIGETAPTHESLRASFSNRINQIGPMLPCSYDNFSQEKSKDKVAGESQAHEATEPVIRHEATEPVIRIHDLRSDMPSSRLSPPPTPPTNPANPWPAQTIQYHGYPPGYRPSLRYGQSAGGHFGRQGASWYIPSQPSNVTNANPYINQWNTSHPNWIHRNQGGMINAQWPSGSAFTFQSKHSAYIGPHADTTSTSPTHATRTWGHVPVNYRTGQHANTSTQQNSTPASWPNNYGQTFSVVPSPRGHISNRNKRWDAIFNPSKHPQTVPSKDQDNPKNDGSTKCSVSKKLQKDQTMSGIKPIIIDPVTMPNAFKDGPSVDNDFSETKEQLISTKYLEELGIRIKTNQEIEAPETKTQETKPAESISLEVKDLPADTGQNIVENLTPQITNMSDLSEKMVSQHETIGASKDIEEKRQDVMECSSEVKSVSEQNDRKNELVDSLPLTSKTQKETEDATKLMFEQAVEEYEIFEASDDLRAKIEDAVKESQLTSVTEQTDQKKKQDPLPLKSSKAENAEDASEPDTTQTVTIKSAPTEDVLKPILEEIVRSSDKSSGSSGPESTKPNFDSKKPGGQPVTT